MPKATKNSVARARPDLTLLKKLVAELEASVINSDSLDSNTQLNEYIVELSKGAGLAAGVMQEAAALIADVHAIVRMAQGPAAKKDDYNVFLDKILGPLKGHGNTN